MGNEITLTNRDYKALEQEVLEKVKEWSEGKYSNFNDADPGTMLLKTFMKLHDMNNYYIDSRASEAFPDRAKERKNVRSMLRLIGYKLKGYISTEIIVTVNLSTPLVAELQLERFALLDSEVPFVVKEFKDIDAGLSSFSFTAVQGEVVPYTFTVADIDSKGRLHLDRDDLAENLVTMTMGGFEWTKVDNVYMIKDLGKYFHIDYDSEDKMYIQLIPGYVNYLVGDKGEIEIRALASKGDKGLVAENVIEGFAGNVKDINGTDIKDTMTLTNTKPIIYGKGKQTIAEGIMDAQRNLRQMETLVALPDYEAYCEEFEGVSRALAVDISIPASGILQPYFVRVYLVNDEGTAVAEEIKDAIIDDMTLHNRQIRGNQCEILDGIPRVIGGSILVHLRDATVSSDIISNKIQTAWDEFYRLKDRKFGEQFKFTKLLTSLSRAHDNILYIETSDILDYNLAFNEFPVKGALTISYQIGY